ncbi:MAG: hypothetical protein QF493_14025 [Rhodospirillales bacterium]|nr:hypothetical protein [Rhodospirillales bacterium]
MFNSETGDVDLKKTDKKRASMRKNRLKQGKPFNEFVAGWLKKRPNEEIIQNYGNYPEPRVENYDKPFWGMYE